MAKCDVKRYTFLKIKYLIILCAGIGLVIVIAGLVYLAFTRGWYVPNAQSASSYKVKGVDVSSYQGDIDWQQLATNKIDFAYIKATEGSSFVDPKFQENWQKASTTNLRIGAYHFFSFESSGQSQAENFIRTVPKSNFSLPPVVDVEFYRGLDTELPAVSEVRSQLASFIRLVENYYGKKVIIYALYDSYAMYIQDNFLHNDIWIRDTLFNPNIDQSHHWLFWQYTAKGKLTGYQGQEEFIDLNVFSGSEKEFMNL